MSENPPGASPPVILLAFARSEDPRFQGLPRLPKEARLLREALEPAETAGQIKLEIRQDATLDDILRAFDRFRDRVAIFHFAGHTDDQSLLAERLLGAEALLAAVHAQTELKLVFLNACENQAQAEGLHAAGTPAAIVTSEEVVDDLCPTFAMRFYRALAGGFTPAEAFDKARLAAEGEAYEQSGQFDHDPWLLSTPDPAAGAWRLPPPVKKRVDPIPLQKPLRTQHFIGREKELAQLLADLQPGKPVTLCGPGGMGKSALGAEAIWTLAPGDHPPARFPDGIIFHTFYHQPQADLALEAIARAYGVDPRPTPGTAALQALAGKTALLVLDGTEAADDLKAVLAVAGGCGVLITTRQHKQAPDKWQDIAPLPRAESLDLLRAWADAYAADEHAANEIVRLFGGLPLALFLAGRYLVQQRQMAAEFVEWLQETGLKGLHFDQRPSESIPLLLQRSLAEVSESACAAFGVAGILAFAPFERLIVGAALDTTPAAAGRSLGELVDLGLLLRPDDSYQVTHALAHSYARTQAAPSVEVINRLALHFVALAETESAKGPAGYAILDDQRAHIVAVQTAALKAEQWDAVRQITWEIDYYLDLQGYSTDRHLVIQAGLAAARASGARDDEAEFLNLLGNAYYSLGEPRRAIELYEQRLVIAREIGDRRGEGIALGSLGNAHAALGEPRRAIELYEQRLVIARDIGDRHGEGAAVGNLGIAYADLGEPRRAIELYEQQLVIVREIGDRRGEGNALGNLGLAYADLGEPHRAIELYEQQLVIVRDIGDRRGEGNALGSLGNAYAALGETHRAIEYHEQYLTIAREIGDRRGEAIGSWNLGEAYETQGDLAQAIAHMQVCVAYEQEIGHPDSEADAQRVDELRARLAGSA